MRNKIPKKVMDVSGVELTPGKPTVCLGNGEQGFEGCCDECDYYLICFPELDPDEKKKKECFFKRAWQKLSLKKK